MNIDLHLHFNWMAIGKVSLFKYILSAYINVIQATIKQL